MLMVPIDVTVACIQL